MSASKKYKISVVRKQVEEIEVPGNSTYDVREKVKSKVVAGTLPDTWSNTWYEVVKVEEVK